MDLANLEDYQFVLLIIVTTLFFVLLTLCFFYSVKRKYDSIDKHLDNNQNKTYKECVTEYEALTNEINVELNSTTKKSILQLIKHFIKK